MCIAPDRMMTTIKLTGTTCTRHRDPYTKVCNGNNHQLNSDIHN